MSSDIAIAARAAAFGLHSALHSCSCFRLCSERDARSFHLRLPVVTSRASPWHAYVSAAIHLCRVLQRVHSPCVVLSLPIGTRVSAASVGL